MPRNIVTLIKETETFLSHFHDNCTYQYVQKQRRQGMTDYYTGFNIGSGYVFIHVGYANTLSVSVFPEPHGAHSRPIYSSPGVNDYQTAKKMLTCIERVLTDCVNHADDINWIVDNLRMTLAQFGEERTWGRKSSQA